MWSAKNLILEKQMWNQLWESKGRKPEHKENVNRLFILKRNAFCAEDAFNEFEMQQTKKPIAKREIVSMVNTMKFKRNIMETAELDVISGDKT